MRRPDWHRRMQEAIAAGAASAFTWHDPCCLFVAGVVDAMTDGDYTQRMLAAFPSYDRTTDMRNAVEAGGGLRTLMTGFLGTESLLFGRAGIGDVVLLRDDADREVLGICEGAQVVVATARGVVAFPLSRALCVWLIP